MSFKPDPKKGIKPKKVKRPIRRTPIKKSYKPTGEKEIFEKLIRTREHVSFISGVPIHNIGPGNCHHVLYPKDDYDLLRLYEPNIVFLTNYEHSLIHNCSAAQRAAYRVEMEKVSVIVDWDKLIDHRAAMYKYWEEIK